MQISMSFGHWKPKNKKKNKMAITITNEPLKVSPVGNPLVFEFYEGTQSDFNSSEYYFSIDLYVDTVLVGNYQTVVMSVFDNGVDDDGYSKFDCSNIIELYLNQNKRNDEVVVSGNIVSYYVEITPVVNGGSGTLVTSSTRYAFKSRLTKANWIDWIGSSIFPNTSSGTTPVEWLTQYPTSDNYYVGLDEQCFLFAIRQGVNFNQLDFELFDSNDASITTSTFTFASPIADTIFANTSPQNIIDNTTVTEANFNSCAYYTVIAKDDTGTPVTLTDTFTFHIDLFCTRYEKIRLYFLSKIGSVESFTAKQVNRQTVQTNTSMTESIWGGFIPDGTTSNDYTFSTETGGKRTHLIQSKKSIRIETDWMSESFQNWFVENFYESPEVVMEIDGVFYSANVINRRYELKKTVNDKLIRETLTLEYAHGNTSPLI